jgi:hypothetical protein
VLLGLISAMLMAGAGFLTLSLLRIGERSLRLGLAPPVGVALLAVVGTWGVQLGAPEVLVGLIVTAVCVLGLALALGELVTRVGRCLDEHRLVLAMLACALLVPPMILWQAASIRAGVPNYVHDGAHHAETIEALRRGGRVEGFGWYPVGFHAPAAALLALVPGVDSASGAVGWGVGLTLLAPLALFGFAGAVWRDLRVSAVSALLLALTNTYPYELHEYSLWPMAAGLLLVMGLWTTLVEYFSKPSIRLALLGGLLASALLLTHGTEIYTAGLGVVVLAASRVQVVARRPVAVHIGVALGFALLLALPYLPTLAGWASGGGAVSVGQDYYDFQHQVIQDDLLQGVLLWGAALSSGFLVDLPVRAGLLGVGVWLVLSHRTGRWVVVLGVVFAGLVATFRYVDTALVKAVFALTLPWAVTGRLMAILPVLTAPLSGVGLVGISDILTRRSGHSKLKGWLSHPRMQRNLRIVLGFGIVLGLTSVLLNALTFSLQTGASATYSGEDARVLGWLGQHAQPGEVLMNDGAADAGIWAPYKANVSIVLMRTGPTSREAQLVRANIGQISARADVRHAACSLGVQYVYHGDAGSRSEDRQFPALDELRKNPGLEELFSSGDAAIFRTHLNCD